MGSVVSLLLFYIASVMATELFAADFPEWFGSIGASLYTLFQFMTLESWSMGIVRPVMETQPFAWIFFILLKTFAVLNLFIAIMVDAMSAAEHVERKEETRTLVVEEHQAVMSELRAIRAELAALIASPAERFLSMVAKPGRARIFKVPDTHRPHLRAALVAACWDPR